MSSKSAKQAAASAEGQTKNSNTSGKSSASPAAGAANRSSQPVMRDHTEHHTERSSVQEISIIETMTSFLEANGARELDKEVLRNMAEALSKRINDTSPGTLQDVTMENTFGVGYRSPCVSLQYQGSTSPAGQGRSVREFEEQMATLRKENFNLKLRLYFIEESIPGYQANSADGQEALSKQLIDAKVEMEMLRKEIQEKQDILKEAAQAMNQMEKIQKETECKSQAVVDELNHKIQYLEMEREMEKSHNGNFMNDLLGHSDISGNMNALHRIRELEGIVKQSEDRVFDLQNQVSKLDNLLAKSDETIKEYEDKVKELVFQNAELLEALETKEKEMANVERIIRGLRLSNADLKEDNQNLADALKVTQSNFRSEMSNMKICERQMREQQETLCKMQSQRLREELQEHKTELADKTCMLQEADEQLKNRIQIHEQSCRTIQKLMMNIKNQQVEINRLKQHKQEHNASSASAASFGKEHVNGSSTSNAPSSFECTGLCRSLSDSEALQELTNGGQRQKLEAVIKQQEVTIKTLKSEIKRKTANLQNLVNKELWEKNREIERLIKLLNKSPSSPLSPATTTAASDVGASGGELQQSFSDVEYAKALERNKLLQRKVDILIQRLGVERNNEALMSQLRNDLRESRNDAERAEKWRRECADVCTVLSNRLEELAGFLNSLLKHKDVLGVLAADRRRAMRKAVDRSLDLSKSLNRTLSISGGNSLIDQSLAQLSNLSEILGEYEGGLEKTYNSHEELHAQQSIETLKAENKALKKELDKRRSVPGDVKKDRRSLPLPNLEHSESEAWSEPDRKVSLARIGLEEHSTTLAKDLAAPQQLDTDSESEAVAAASAALSQSQCKAGNSSQSTKTRTQERLVQLEQLLAQRDEHILEIAVKLVDADNRLKKEHLRVLDMTQEIEQLRQRNAELHNDLLAIGTGDGAEAAAVDQTLLLRQIDEKTRSLERIQEERDRIVVEARLAGMQITTLKSDLDEQHKQHDTALTQAALHEQRKLAQLQRDMDALLQQRLDEQQRLHKETLARDWIARTLYEQTQQQLTELQRQFVEAQRNIDCLHENEQELKQTLVDSELATRALKKQLDESTLQASKAVLERTKALNDKLQLEKRVQQLTQQLSAQEAERQQLQRQLVQQQQQQQLAAGKTNTATTQLNNSDVSQSGYTSEEVPASRTSGENGVNAAVAAQRVATVGAQRHNNSSPDLGIESDVGRLSGVELAHAQRTMLKTVELASTKADTSGSIKEELSDGADENMQPLQPTEAAANTSATNATTPKHDCAKVEQENAELRRKLIRTKRAFEDTYEKLRVANQRKAQIEKDIKNQILKTHNVLKNVRSNMENEL